MLLRSLLWLKLWTLLFVVINSKDKQRTNSSMIIKPWRFNCDSYEWLCDSGECILHEEVCDGEVHCYDGSDESVIHCLNIECPNFAYRCAYGACIAGNRKCDGINNCRDGSDETELLCKPMKLNEFIKYIQGECRNERTMHCKSGECIENDRVCDGHFDCMDGSDETVELCSYLICPDYAFQCGYGACVTGQAICNGISDCIDDSDEQNTKCMKSLSTKTLTTFNAIEEALIFYNNSILQDAITVNEVKRDIHIHSKHTTLILSPT